MLDPLHKAIGWLLSLFYALPPHNLGISIILMTAVVMAIMLPLTAKQVRSMVAMQRLQPEIKRIQQEHKEDRQAQSEAIMAFYQENNINPLSGCLPLIIQLPVWIALFGTLREMPKFVVRATASSTGGMARLYTDLCGDKAVDACNKNPANLRFSGMNLRWSLLDARDNVSFLGLFPYVIMIAIVVITGFIQVRQTMARQQKQGNAAQANPQAQTMMKIMPIMNLMTAFFPSGIGLYWLTRNVWTIGQQHFVLAKYYEEKGEGGSRAATTTIEANATEAEDKTKRDNTSKKKKQQQRRRR